MVSATSTSLSPQPRYIGLRASAAEFTALKDDGFRYQLINGVVVMSPSPGQPHQALFFHLLLQLGNYVEQRQAGLVLPDTDVRFDDETVYRPDISFFLSGRHRIGQGVVEVVPDLIIEILSPSTTGMDQHTKRADYEAAGVREYWLVNPSPLSVEVLRLRNGRFEPAVVGERVPSEVIVGFELDLATLRSKLQL